MREHAADRRVGRERQQYGDAQRRRLGRQPQLSLQDQCQDQRGHRQSADGSVQIVQRDDIESFGMLARRAQGRQQSRNELRHGFEGRIVVVEAHLGIECDELRRGCDDGRFQMHAGIHQEGLADDAFLLGSVRVPAAELVKDRVIAPQPVVGFVGHVVPVGAKAYRRVRAMFAEIAFDDAVLDQPPEQEARPARRKGEVAGDGEIRQRAKRYAGGNRESGEAQARRRP